MNNLPKVLAIITSRWDKAEFIEYMKGGTFHVEEVEDGMLEIAGTYIMDIYPLEDVKSIDTSSPFYGVMIDGAPLSTPELKAIKDLADILIIHSEPYLKLVEDDDDE